MATSTGPLRRRARPRTVGKVLLAEGVVGAAVLAYRGPGLAFAGVLALGAAALLAAFGRADGRSWFAHVRQRRRLALRRRRAAAEVLAGELSRGHADPLAARLRAVAGPLELRDVAVPAEHLGAGGPDAAPETVDRVGVGLDEGGWFAAVEVPDGAPLPLAELAALVGDTHHDAAALSTLQVCWPGAWVAVRLSPADAVRAGHADPAARAGAVRAEPAAAVAAGAVRVVRLLRRYGHPARPLDAARLAAALGAACGLAGPPQEHWHRWECGGRAHVAFAVSAWPAGVQPEALLALLSPGGRAALTVTGAPHGRSAASAMIAVVGPQSRVEGLVSGLWGAAAAAGLGLRRLDGEHAPAVWALAPAAAGLPTAWPGEATVTARLASAPQGSAVVAGGS
jgi:hypothetical protein